MLVTKKQKRVLGISLIVAMIVAILVAMSIGIYFIVRSGKNQLLSKDQQIFGQAFSSLSNNPTEEVVDSSLLPEGMSAEEVRFVTDKFYISASGTDYKIFSKESRTYVSVNFEFDQIEDVRGNVAIVSGAGGRSLINLKNGTLIGGLQNAKVTFAGGHALVESVDRGRVEFLGSSQAGLVAYVLDLDSLECVYSVSDQAGALKLDLSDNYIFAYYSEKTEAVLLKDPSRIKVFANTPAAQGKGFVSDYTSQQCIFSDFTRLSELGEDAILVEKAIADDNNFDIKPKGEKGYRLEYYVYNLENDVQVKVESSGYTLSKEAAGVKGYVAIVFSKINNKQAVSNTEKTIKYYQFGASNSYKLKEIVKFDYIKNGKVTGFNGKSLIVSGGNTSGEVDFAGNNTQLLSTQNNEKVSFSNNIYVVTSIIGEKTIYAKDGTKLFDKSFLMVSPFYNGFALAYDGEYFYVLNSNKDASDRMSKIKPFAESVDYAFMGMGLYFVEGKEGGVDVVRLGGERIYKDASVKFTLLSASSVLLTVNNGNSTSIHKISTQRAYVHLQSIAPVFDDVASQKQFAHNEKGALESDNKLETTKDLVVDAESGVGKITYGFNLNVENISFKDFGDLSNSELALLPSFDVSNTYVDASSGKVFAVEGAYFLTNTNIAVAIIKMRSDEKAYYAISVALREMYISSISATATNAGVTENMRGFAGALPYDFSTSVVAPTSQGLFLYGEEAAQTTRVPSFVGSGYDGGFVLSCGEAQSISFEVELRNTYFASGLFGDYIDYTQSTGEQTFEYNGFMVVVDYAAKTATIKAADGLMINGFTLAYGRSVAAVYTDAEDKADTVFDVLVTEQTFELDSNETIFRIKDVALTELYHKINLVDEEENELGNIYYFGGYGRNNPARLGFKDFYRRETIDIPEKEGYTFKGYKYSEWEGFAIDQTGAYVATQTFVKTTTGVDSFTFVAEFEANTYKIYFDVLNELVMADGLDVVFNSKVGDGLLTYERILELVESSPVLKNLVLGHEFGGWFTSQNGEGEEFTSDTDYVVAGNTILYAKMTPRTYEITLHSNIEEYKDKQIDGFVYNIDEITLLEPFKTSEAGAAFTSTTIEVTFGTEFGQLPVLVGKSAGSGSVEQRYTFVGWFDLQALTYLGEGEFSRGNKVENDTLINQPPVTDLYAHFVRDVYSVDVSVNSNDQAFDGENPMDALSALHYTGSDQNGKAIEKSIGGEGEQIWEADQNKYLAYSLQGENLSLAFKVNNGYYVRQITISVYLLNDVPAVYTLPYTWNPETQSSSAGSVLDNEYVKITNDEEIEILLKQMNNEGARTSYATIEIDVDAKTYETTFDVSSQNNISITADDGVDVNTDGGAFNFFNIIFGSEHEFAIDLSGDGSTANSFVKTISVGEKTINFTLEYKEYDGRSYLVVTGSEEGSETMGEGIIETRFVLVDGTDKIEFVCKNNIETGVLQYAIVARQTQNYTINIEVEDISASVNVNAHAGLETSADGLNISATLNGEDSAIDANLSPADVLEYKLSAATGNVISNITMKIGEQNYSLFRTTLAVNDSGFVLSATSVASNTWFTTRSGVVYLNGTGVYVSYSQEDQTYTIHVTNLAMDISFDVYFFSMTILEVKGAGTGFEYEVVVTDGSQSLVGTNIKETATEVTSGTTLAGNNVYNVGNVFCFVGYKDSMKGIRLSILTDAENAYRISSASSAPEGYCQVATNRREVEINLGANTITIMVEDFAGTLSGVASFLGIGEGEYEKDPIEGLDFLSDIDITYNNAEHEEITTRLGEDFAAVDFVGNVLLVRVYSIVGYYYSSARLKTANGEIVPTVSEGENGGKKFTLLRFVIDDYSLLNFELEVYQDAMEFDIAFDPSNDENHTATGEMENVHFVYNVEGRLPAEGFERPFYTLVGFSLTPVEGIELSIFNCDFVVNDIINRSDFPRFNITEDGAVVTLYAVFEANSFEVNLVLNDSQTGTGSTLSSTPRPISSIKTDRHISGLETLTREGYTFLGWFTANDVEATEINNDDVLDAELLSKMTISEGVLQIHARWLADTFTVIVHKNDASEGDFGSTSATGGAAQYSIAFDTPFEPFDALTRLGYNFLGYKAVRLTSSQVASDTHGYFGYGEGCKLVLDADAGSYGIDINNEAKIIDIYAVYSAQIFRAYVYLNNQGMPTYGQDDGAFTVSFNGRVVRSAVAFVDVYKEVVFDSAFGTLPSVEPRVYDFRGFYAGKEDPLGEPSSERLTGESVLNLELFEKLFFTSSTSQTSPLSALYDGGTLTFSLYSYYTERNFNIIYRVDGNNPVYGYNLERVAQKEDYDYTAVSESGGSNSAAGPYGSNFVFDIMTKTGTYIKTITIGYNDNNYQYRTLVVTFRWDNTGKVLYSVSGAGIEDSDATNEFVAVMGSTLYVATGIYMKVLDYNKNGADAKNVVVDASRIILAFETVKTDMTVSLEVEDQTFDVAFYRFVSGAEGIEGVTTPEEFVELRQIAYGTEVTEEFFKDHAYTQGFKFVTYYYGVLEGGHIANPTENPNMPLNIGDTFKDNTILVGYYEFSRRQAVNFYFYDTLSGTYKLREETSKNYVLMTYDDATHAFVYGEFDGVNYSLSGDRAGRLLTLPSLSEEAWPENTYLVGFIVANGAPESGYYSFSLGNTTGHDVFDTNYIVDTEVNVYAVYNNQRFELEMNLDSSTGQLQARADYELYNVGSNGSIQEVQPNEIYLVSLTAEQMSVFEELNGDSEQNAAVALGKALGWDLEGRRPLESKDFSNFGSAPSEETYYFLITIAYSSTGEAYITLVSSNGYMLSGGVLSSFAL